MMCGSSCGSLLLKVEMVKLKYRLKESMIFVSVAIVLSKEQHKHGSSWVVCRGSFIHKLDEL